MRCHGCLREIPDDSADKSPCLCRTCSQKLFGKNKFDTTLHFTLPDLAQKQNHAAQRISISGAQPKFSLKIAGKELVATDRDGRYILKPATSTQFKRYADMPANEHVTMQIARQIFKMNVAEAALVKFQSGEYAYLTKRYDVRTDGTRIHQEDMAQVADLAPEKDGKNYKYESNYERIAELLKEHVSAYAVAAEQFFKTLLFNYIVCNGDAHIKNFSIYCPDQEGVFVLAPAYDLMNTALHTSDERTALDLFKDEGEFETEFFKANGFYGAPDFMEFAKRIGIVETRAKKFISEFTRHAPQMESMLDNSFLSEEAKTKYKECIRDRVKALEGK